LPPATHFRTVRLKSAAHAAAVAMGIATPPQIVAPTADAARAFAEHHGYPAVVKLDIGSAGTAVRICADAEQLARALTELSAAPGAGSETNKPLIEKHIEGPGFICPLVAAEGEVLAGFTLEKLQRHPLPLGPSSVVRVVDIPAIAEALGRFVAHTSYSGFAMPEFIIDRASGVAHWIEFNSRPAPQTHWDEAMVGMDLMAAWHAHLAGTPVPKFRGPIVGRTIALFPQELQRDSSSRFLSTGAVQDVPWDDVPLLQAYLGQQPQRRAAG
jgi:biotin carboxylase